MCAPVPVRASRCGCMLSLHICELGDLPVLDKIAISPDEIVISSDKIAISRNGSGSAQTAITQTLHPYLKPLIQSTCKS